MKAYVHVAFKLAKNKKENNLKSLENIRERTQTNAGAKKKCKNQKYITYDATAMYMFTDNKYN